MAEPVLDPSKLDMMDLQPEGGSGRFGSRVVSFASQMGLTGLGAMLVSVEPGKRAFPFHNHLSNDEMFVILEGSGTYRLGDSEFPVKAGDVCAAPHGGPDTAHQLINTGVETLRYIGISTQSDPEIVEYPDSGKYAAIGIAPGKHFFDAHIRVLGRREDSLGYWDGEDT